MSFRRGVIGAILPLAILAGCGGEPPPETPVRPVRILVASPAGAEQVRTFSGTARASLESRLSFRVPGTVRRVAVDVGDTVRPGALLAELDPSDYRLQVEDAEAALARARAEARNARANLERTRGLYENRNASENELDAARTAFESASAAVESGSKKLELVRNQLDYTRLTAPVAGAIAEVKVEVNENVGSGRVVVVLSSGSRAEVELAIPENLITRVVEGQEVVVTFDAIPERRYPGAVTEVGVTTTGLATTFPVTVRLLEDEPEVRPGMTSEVRFTFEGTREEDRFLIPAHAVGEDHEGRFVFTVERQAGGRGLARRVAVRTGRLIDDRVEVLEGLSAGDLVITAGVSRVHDGLVVKLPEEAGTGT